VNPLSDLENTGIATVNPLSDIGEHRSSAPSIVLLLPLALVFACEPEPDEACVVEGQNVLPDDTIQGHRAGDVIERYFGDYRGTLNWSTGGVSAFNLSIWHETGQPYRLSNVYQCRARNLGSSSHARFSTDDGAFDNELRASIHGWFPGVTAVTDRVAHFSTIYVPEWREMLASHLAVDPSRYEAPYLELELDWRSGFDPTAGGLSFHGVLKGSSLSDRIVVGRLAFEQN
jgi:hypothetical protein